MRNLSIANRNRSDKTANRRYRESSSIVKSRDNVVRYRCRLSSLVKEKRLQFIIALINITIIIIFIIIMLLLLSLPLSLSLLLLLYFIIITIILLLI